MLRNTRLDWTHIAEAAGCSNIESITTEKYGMDYSEIKMQDFWLFAHSNNGIKETCVIPEGSAPG